MESLDLDRSKLECGASFISLKNKVVKVLSIRIF